MKKIIILFFFAVGIQLNFSLIIYANTYIESIQYYDFQCDEVFNTQRQDCLYGNQSYSPDNPLIRDLININLIEQKSIRVNFYSFSDNNNIPFWDENNYLDVLEDLNTQFANTKINFIGTFNSLSNDDLLNCYNNDYQEESCQELPQCSFNRQNQLCYFNKYWIANEYNQSNDSIYVFVGRYKMNNGPTPWRDQIIPHNRSIFLTQFSYAYNSKTVIHEFGHKFGLLHTFHGIFYNNGDCNMQNSCWAEPTFSNPDFCDMLENDECLLNSIDCYWDDSMNYCQHIRNISGDLCSDTYPIPPPDNSLICNFPDAICNEVVYDYNIENYNNNFMEYGYGCNEYDFTYQQIQRMHGWIEYNFEVSPNNFSNLCNFIEDYECILYGCTDPLSCNYNGVATLNDGSCVYSYIGDVNSDCEINVIDVVIMVNLVLQPDLVSDEQLLSADINHDSTLNIVDIVLLVQQILN